MTDATPRWLDAEAAARYISVRVTQLPRLVKLRRIPEPTRALGDRSPRWDRLALDETFNGGTASTNHRLAVTALAEKEAQGRARRSA